MDFESRRIEAYFSHLNALVGPVPGLQIVVVAHMVANSAHFLPALNTLGNIALLLPKPSARDSETVAEIRDLGFAEATLSRDWSADSGAVCRVLDAHLDGDSPFVVVDIGGYFAEPLKQMSDYFGSRFLGVMEGTENGVRKYEMQYGSDGAEQFPVPVVTVARSPLKLPEDYLVGASVIFSVEAALRTQAQILQTRSACVIGYGRVGSGVAEVLRGRGISTVVHDESPIAMAEAAARGFQVFRRLDEALGTSNLVISATGNHALDASALSAVRTGTLIATVTSADDEFGEDGPLDYYTRSEVSPGLGDLITRYDSDNQNNKYFWLINDGKAANFAHGAVIGPAIQLIEGEKLYSVKRLAEEAFTGPRDAVFELGRSDRVAVATIWNEHFLSD